MYSGLDVWSIPEEQFPSDGKPEDKLRFLTRYAILAPSDRNSQPWRSTIDDGRLKLFADRSRSLAIIDPEDRELHISCGAALCFLKLALHYFGYAGEIQLLPEPEEPDLLATIGLGEGTRITLEEEALFLSIPERRTHRPAFDQRPVSWRLLTALRYVAGQEQAWLEIIEDQSGREAVAHLVAEADRRQFADREFREEFSCWMTPNRCERRDGVPGYGFGFPDRLSRLGPVFTRHVNWGRIRGRRDRRTVLRAPVLVVLGTDAEGPTEWLRAGQALARVLLRAQSDGVFASHLNQAIEVPELRPRLAEAIGRSSGFPQLLLRLGYGHELTPTPRRGVADVLGG